jgi:hypothetical protein
METKMNYFTSFLSATFLVVLLQSTVSLADIASQKADDDKKMNQVLCHDKQPYHRDWWRGPSFGELEIGPSWNTGEVAHKMQYTDHFRKQVGSYDCKTTHAAGSVSCELGTIKTPPFIGTWSCNYTPW